MPPEQNGNPISYEIQSAGNATISSVVGVPNTKVASYGGIARLVKFGDGKTRTLPYAFALPFRMTLTRQPQP